MGATQKQPLKESAINSGAITKPTTKDKHKVAATIGQKTRTKKP